MIRINKAECIGCELCVSMCGEVFEMQGDMKAEVISQKKKPVSLQDAIDSCPTGAIEK